MFSIKFSITLLSYFIIALTYGEDVTIANNVIIDQGLDNITEITNVTNSQVSNNSTDLTYGQSTTIDEEEIINENQFADWQLTCGKRKISQREAKIVGGHKTYRGQYPWAVSIRIGDRHHCGGALINPQWILTAAHCIASASASTFVVRLGSHSRGGVREEGILDIPVKTAVTHEKFTFQTFDSDVALLKLTKKVQYSKYIQPVCLPKSVENYDGKLGTVIGWGRLSSAGVPAEDLQQVDLPILENSVCEKWIESQGKFVNLRSGQFCAGFEKGGRDACQGDSGGPMMLKNSTSTQSMVIGLVSAGIGCALPKLPGVYTKVAFYLPWIEQTLKRLEHN